MDNKPLISIVILTYNRYNLLKKSLDSIINQTYKNLEIIIADNHSEDGTEDLCKEYSKNDSRIKYFRQSQNIGMTNNVNFAVNKISGDYWLSVCDDDWLDLDYIEKCVNFANQHPDYAFISPRTKLYDNDYNLIKASKIINLEQEKPEDRISNYIENNLFCLMASGLLKRSYIEDLHKSEGVIYNDRYAEDWIFIIKALLTGKGKILKETHYNKLNNGGTASIASASSIWDVSDITQENYWDKLFEKISDSILNDKFFKLYADEKKLKELSEIAKKGIIKANKRIYNPNNLSVEYLKRHPLFFLRKNFYKLIYKTIKG